MSAGSGALVSHAPSLSALRVVIRKQPCSRTALPRAKAEQTWSFTPTYKGRRAQTPASNSRKRLETSASNNNCRHQDAHCSIPKKPQRRRKPLLVSTQRPYRRVSGLDLWPFSVSSGTAQGQEPLCRRTTVTSGTMAVSSLRLLTDPIPLRQSPPATRVLDSPRPGSSLLCAVVGGGISSSAG